MSRLLSLSLLALTPVLTVGCSGGDGGQNLERPDAGDGADGGSGPDSGVTGSDLCAVMQVVMPKCIECHKPNGLFPDLTYDAIKTSIVNVPSQARAPKVLVIPGDSANSFLFRKISGDIAGGDGALMPMNKALSAAEVALVKAWIDDGASTACDLPAGFDPGAERHHPDGYREAATHGIDLRMGASDCRVCHGADLTGGVGTSCDMCHQDNWRTSCTYCHGGTDNTTGAPPMDLNGVTATDQLRFRAHTKHVEQTNHQAYDCDQCHVKPIDVLSTNHVFDDTPGRAEVTFGGGLSQSGDYQGNGSCANMYCHGNGKATGAGSYDHTRGTPDCNGCHPGPGSTRTALASMSGKHARHSGFGCNECHAQTVNAQGAISSPDRHADGTREVAFVASNFTKNGSSCSGSCHNARHSSERW